MRNGATSIGSSGWIRRLLYLLMFIYWQMQIVGGSCSRAHYKCDRDQSCRWHLSELQLRCATRPCARDQCSQALQRFIRYVNRPLVEQMMFCHCQHGDPTCRQQQENLYPRCLYAEDRQLGPITCTEAVQQCEQQPQCQRYSSVFFLYCPVASGNCAIAGGQLDHCRAALIAVRGTSLEYPCYCVHTDMECRKYQMGMLPNNPCVESSMLEYTRRLEEVYIVDAAVEQQQQPVQPQVLATTTTTVVVTTDIPKTTPVLMLTSSSPVPLTTTTTTPMPSHSGRHTHRTRPHHAKTTPMTTTTSSSTSTTAAPITAEDWDLPEDPNPTTLKQAQARPSRPPKTTTEYPVQLVSPDPQLIDFIGSLNADADSQPLVDAELFPEPIQPITRPTTTTSTTSTSTTTMDPGPVTPTTRMMKNRRTTTTSTSTTTSTTSTTTITAAPIVFGKSNEYSFEDTIDGGDDPEWDDRDATVKPSPTTRSFYAKHVSTTKEPSTTTTVIAEEDRPHWDTTTTTREPTTTTGGFVTHRPPPAGGCIAKDANGNAQLYYRNSYIRRYNDWAGRCSSWCHCDGNEDLTCTKLPCMPDGNCAAPLTSIEYGERLYLKDRGACMCQSGNFICDTPEKMIDLNPGVYLLAGYSKEEVAMLRKEVPSEILDPAGFVSAEAFVFHDIASRLQIALEPLMPPDVHCRIMTYDEHHDQGNIIFQLEWYGMDPLLNESEKHWHTGQAEKVCSPYVVKLADAFTLNDAIRYQLLLSTVKQLRVLDLLNSLPTVSSGSIRNYGICRDMVGLYAIGLMVYLWLRICNFMRP